MTPTPTAQLARLRVIIRQPTPAPTDALVEDLQNDQLNADTAPAEEAPQPEGEQPAEEGDAQPAEDTAESTEDTADSESTAE